MEQTPDATRSQGAEVLPHGVRYRTWCEHPSVEALIIRRDGDVIRAFPLEPEGEGYFSGLDPHGKAGDLYRYRLAKDKDWPDPASRFQPHGVHGASMVIDPRVFAWSDAGWKAPPFRDLVIYELHIGAFTPAGTFRAAREKLDHLVTLGVNALELMPIADFPGERNWGYDGVSLYAPARAYGAPDDLRALVDAAHGRGLAVILDVVYNHLGPDGNYIGLYHRAYWNPRHKTPWGAGLNFEQSAVRSFFTDNPLYWMREFHIDGFRLDATHAIADDSPRHVLAEIAERVQEEGGFVVAEDERNEAKLLMPVTRGGVGVDGCWADDFHHTVRVMLTGERESYFANFEGTANELKETLRNGWLFSGQQQTTTGKPRGTNPAELRPEQFVYCISNHDQVGNRAFGERLGQAISPAAWRAASALLCLVPQTPLLFMGQEWNTTAPFQFFTDHAAELGKKITDGRRREFRHFAAFNDPERLRTIPDPQAETTFRNSKLPWDELESSPHRGILQLYREFLRLRRQHRAFRPPSRESYIVRALENDIIALLFGKSGAWDYAVICDLIGGHEAPDLAAAQIIPGKDRKWHPLLSSNGPRFGTELVRPFQVPTTLVLEAR